MVASISSRSRPPTTDKIIQFGASLLICWFACNLSADTPQIRLSVQVEGDDDVQMVSALSREFRKLDGVSLTDSQPTLIIRCVVYQIHGVAQQSRGGSLKGYAASVAIIASDGLITHSVHTGPSVDALAHDIAISLDGSIIEQMRRAAQPSRFTVKMLNTPCRQMHVYEVRPRKDKRGVDLIRRRNLRDVS